MNPKQGAVWPNYSFGCGANPPNGCLLNPEGSKLIFFEEIKHSHKNNFKIYTHVFYTNYIGEPARLKSSEKLKVNSLREKWHELLSKGWTEVSHNYG